MANFNFTPHMAALVAAEHRQLVESDEQVRGVYQRARSVEWMRNRVLEIEAEIKTLQQADTCNADRLARLYEIRANLTAGLQRVK